MSKDWFDVALASKDKEPKKAKEKCNILKKKIWEIRTCVYLTWRPMKRDRSVASNRMPWLERKHWDQTIQELVNTAKDCTYKFNVCG